MGLTFAQKVLARSAGLSSVEVGQIVTVHPRHLLTHDNTAAIIGKIGEELEQYGIADPDQPVIVLDHISPARDTASAEAHRRVREFIARFDLRHFFDIGEGICHQVMLERGLAPPGEIVVGSDSHTCTYGAVGAFATGIDRTEAAALLLTGETWLKVPPTIKVLLSGSLPAWVTAKDLVLKLIGLIGADGASYQAVEYHGDIDKLGIDVCITSTQKALGLPPGLSVCTISEKALVQGRTVENRGLYLDLIATYDYMQKKPYQYPSTPSLSHYYALDKQLDYILDVEGLENRFARHLEMAKITRAWGNEHFEQFAAKGYESNTLTTIKNTKGISVADLNKRIGELGYMISNGYGDLKEKTFRIAHMADRTVEVLKELLDVLDKEIAKM